MTSPGARTGAPAAADEAALAGPRNGRPLTAVLIVSHSRQLAEGVSDIVAQMAPQVVVQCVGGDPAGGIGTHPAAVEDALRSLLADGHEVLLTTDLGSALMVAEMAVETVLGTEEEQETAGQGRALVVDVPVARGTLAAAVEATSGADVEACAFAARAVLSDWKVSSRPGADAQEDECVRHEAPAASRLLRLSDPSGLHARPAAALAGILTEERARLWLDGRPATTLSQILVLGLVGTAHTEATVVGRDPEAVLDRVQSLLDGAAPSRS